MLGTTPGRDICLGIGQENCSPNPRLGPDTEMSEVVANHWVKNGGKEAMRKKVERARAGQGRTTCTGSKFSVRSGNTPV